MLQRKHLAWAVDMFLTARKCRIRVSKEKSRVGVQVGGWDILAGKISLQEVAPSLLYGSFCVQRQLATQRLLLAKSRRLRREKPEVNFLVVPKDSLYLSLGCSFKVLVHFLKENPVFQTTDTESSIKWISCFDRSGMINV